MLSAELLEVLGDGVCGSEETSSEQGRGRANAKHGYCCCLAELHKASDSPAKSSIDSDRLRGNVVFGRGLTVAAVLQIGPDDVFLREAENAQSPSSHGGVDRHTRVGHQLSSLIKAGPVKKRPQLSRTHFENLGQ